MHPKSSLKNGLMALAGIALLAIGWRVLAIGMADHFAHGDPFRALSWVGGHPVALGEAAEKTAKASGLKPLLRGELAKAETLARAALAANPREGRAWRVLGALAEARGDRAEAVRLHELAAKHAPRDLPTHVWLERHYLQAGQLEPALSHIDLLLRVEPGTREQQFPVLRALAALPGAHAALAELLARRPPWREAFVADLARNSEDSQSVTPLMTRLRQAPDGLADSELSAWIDRLDRDGRWGEAYLTWVASLPADRQDELGNVFNGGFEREPGNSGFDWRIGRVPGAYIQRLPDTGSRDGLALRVSFEDRRVPFNHVRQLLALPPGRYRLQGRARAEGLRSVPGMVWSVSCADDRTRVLASTEPVRGHTAWREFSAPFEVEPGACGGQWLQLAVPARIRAEQRIGGRAWFDDLRIVRESGDAVGGQL